MFEVIYFWRRSICSILYLSLFYFNSDIWFECLSFSSFNSTKWSFINYSFSFLDWSNSLILPYNWLLRLSFSAISCSFNFLSCSKFFNVSSFSLVIAANFYSSYWVYCLAVSIDCWCFSFCDLISFWCCYLRVSISCFRASMSRRAKLCLPSRALCYKTKSSYLRCFTKS